MVEEIGITTTAYHFQYDGNGNVTEITDHTGAKVATYRYDAFGNTLVATGSYAATNRYRFSTKPLDNEIASAPLYYYAYRYYDPITGRWPSRDPIGEYGGINLYGFVGNDGVNSWDLLGLALDPATRIAISGFAGGLTRAEVIATLADMGFTGAVATAAVAAAEKDRKKTEEVSPNAQEECEEGAEKKEEKEEEIQLPAKPEDLGDEWEDVSHPDAKDNGRSKFRNKETGKELEFDKGKPGEPGWRGKDHYHRPNPNATGKGNSNLDANGNPVPGGSGPSHMPPGTRIRM
jgi:RHS repeat-associated protein